MLRNRPSQPRLLPKPPLPPSSGPKAPPSSSRSALSGSELAWARSRSMKEDEAMAPDWLRSGGESKREAGDRRHSVRFEEHGDEDEEDEGCDEDEDEVEARVVVGGGEDQYNLHFEAELRRHNARIWRGEAERTVWEDVRRVEQGLPPRATPRRAEWTPEALRLASDLSTAPRGTHRAGSAYTTRAPSDGIRNAFGATGREDLASGEKTGRIVDRIESLGNVWTARRASDEEAGVGIERERIDSEAFAIRYSPFAGSSDQGRALSLHRRPHLHHFASTSGAEQGGCKLLYARSRLEDDRF